MSGYVISGGREFLEVVIEHIQGIFRTMRLGDPQLRIEDQDPDSDIEGPVLFTDHEQSDLIFIAALAMRRGYSEGYARGLRNEPRFDL